MSNKPEKFELPEDIAALAKLIKEKGDVSSEVSGETAKIGVSNEAYHAAMESLGVSKDEIKNVNEANRKFIAASASVVADESLAVLKKNKGVQEVTANIRMSPADKVEFNVKREDTVRNLQKPDAPPITRHAPMTVKYVANGGLGRLGALKDIRADLMERAAKALA